MSFPPAVSGTVFLLAAGSLAASFQVPETHGRNRYGIPR